MTPEDLEAEAAQMENMAHTQLIMAFANFERQIGAAEALKNEVRKERARILAAPKPKKADGNPPPV